MTDTEILDKLLDGDKDSWERFVENSSPLIRSVVYKTLSIYTTAERQDIDDAVQSVYLKLLKENFRLLKSYDRQKASLSTWLGVISRSVAIDLLRKRKNHFRLDEERASAEIHADNRNFEIDLPKGLLSGRQELILRLLFDKEMEPGDIADFLGVDVQTIRSTKHKAIEKLRKYYKDHS